MAITEILVLADTTAAAETRIKAAAGLAAASGAQLCALLLVAEPFMRALVGKHLPEEFVRQQLDILEQEADQRLQELAKLAAEQGVELKTHRETATIDHLPAILARQGRRADLVVVGPGVDADEASLTEAAFMDTGRPALVVPALWTGVLPPTRALVAWDGSREAARAAGDAIPLLTAAEEVVILTVDVHRAAARYSDEPGMGLSSFLTRHGVKARVKRVTASGGIGDTILAQVAEERADLLVMGGYGHSRVRELLFGGVTRSILESTKTPALVSH
jgi:nucleotide-binding universal stress UspA family protein